MPELPEVETIVRDVARSIPGRIIVGVEVFRPDLIEAEPPERFAASLVGQSIRGVGRRAKNIVIELSGQFLVINLGMTGRLLVQHANESPSSHPGVRFTLDDGRLLAYHDVRRFGRLRRYSSEAWMAREASLGVEPLDSGFTPAVLHRLASASRVAVKSWLMDQRRIVGVGNIYASESLFRAGIDPKRPALTLGRREATRLHAAILEVLSEAIEFRGTTLLDYRDAEGSPGAFADRLRVYDRAGEPCRRCGAPILRLVQGGRSTFFCQNCQR